MVTAGNNDLSFDPNEKENTVENLYESNTEFNANQEQSSGAYWDPEAERQWKERAAAINAQRRLEKKIETKIYKRLIKELLKKI
jgi:Holliday junction resolvase RusA-like endonuclease